MILAARELFRIAFVLLIFARFRYHFEHSNANDFNNIKMSSSKRNGIIKLHPG